MAQPYEKGKGAVIKKLLALPGNTYWSEFDLNHMFTKKELEKYLDSALKRIEKKKKGGKIKTYAKGGGIRKPKY